MLNDFYCNYFDDKKNIKEKILKIFLEKPNIELMNLLSKKEKTFNNKYSSLFNKMQSLNEESEKNSIIEFLILCSMVEFNDFNEFKNHIDNALKKSKNGSLLYITLWIIQRMIIFSNIKIGNDLKYIIEGKRIKDNNLKEKSLILFSNKFFNFLKLL